MIYTDHTLMPFGKYKGIELVNVPAEYLLYVYHNFKDLQFALKHYIEDNKDVLEQQAKKERSLNYHKSTIDRFK